MSDEVASASATVQPRDESIGPGQGDRNGQQATDGAQGEPAKDVKPAAQDNGHSAAPSAVVNGHMASQLPSERTDGENIIVRSPIDPAPTTTSTRGRGGARGGMTRGKPRARSSLNNVKPRKRKRSGDDDDDGDSSSEEISTPTALTTKSGRNVQRPTSFVPQAQASPNGASHSTNGDAANGARVYKKKRVWRKNAENAVCKSCLRGTSPASNMIVFCDGCNTPYHQWCHHPPIAQKVIDEQDAVWYCRACSHERVVPVPENDITHWAAAPGAGLDERRQFFLSLTPGTMITLLLRATNMNPQLPIFAPEWIAKASHRAIHAGRTTNGLPTATTPSQVTVNNHAQQSTIYVQHDDEDEDEGYGPEEHPPHYVRPGKGLMSTLPPDKEDEAILVDEESSRGVFHHVYLVA